MEVPGWLWHPLVMFVVARLGWSLLRRYLGLDPAVWLAKKLRLRGVHRQRDADVIRWALITGLVASVICTGFAVKAAVTYFGPHEGDVAETPFVLLGQQFFESALPPRMELHFTPQKGVTICNNGVLVHVPA